MKHISKSPKIDLVFWSVLLGAFLYAVFFTQGLPLWDDDFTSWLTKFQNRSNWGLFTDLLSPITRQPETWGFNERPLEAVFYRICYWVSGYRSWSYFLIKGFFYAGTAAMIYLWGLRVALPSRWAKWAALAATLVFVTAPGPIAAQIMLCDFAPVAEFLFLASMYLVWNELELERGVFVRRWVGLILITYLAYKAKADTKLIPAIVLIYIFIFKRESLRLYFVVLAMAVLALPWSEQLFSTLPPFLPGSNGSQVLWMWQPASFHNFLDFILPSSFLEWKNPIFSLGDVLGPFLWIGTVVFGIYLMLFRKSRPSKKIEPKQVRGPALILIWLAMISVGVSALAVIPDVFRVRYGILLLVPTCILLARVFSLFSDSISKLPRWIVFGLALFLMIQLSLNEFRSLVFRRNLGRVIVAVDQAYGYVDSNFPNSQLVLLPGFQSYDYRSDSAPVIQNRMRASKFRVLRPTENILALSWSIPRSSRFQQIQQFTGCARNSLFDLVFPCPAEEGVFLLRVL